MSRRMQMGALYLAHGPSLLTYLQRHFPHLTGGGAEDLLQETFLEALDAPESCLAAQSPRGFLFGIARNLALSSHRRARRHPTVPLPALELAAPSAANPALDDMRDAIGKLPDHLRETLELRLRHDLSYDEIAAVLEIPVGTVRSRLHAAVKQLRSAL